MASIRNDKSENGMCNNFELAVSHLIPYDPVENKRVTNDKRNAAQISVAGEPNRHSKSTRINISSIDAQRCSIGKTGLHLQYYKKE